MIKNKESHDRDVKAAQQAAIHQSEEQTASDFPSPGDASVEPTPANARSGPLIPDAQAPAASPLTPETGHNEAATEYISPDHPLDENPEGRQKWKRRALKGQAPQPQPTTEPQKS